MKVPNDVRHPRVRSLVADLEVPKRPGKGQFALFHKGYPTAVVKGHQPGAVFSRSLPGGTYFESVYVWSDVAEYGTQFGLGIASKECPLGKDNLPTIRMKVPRSYLIKFLEAYLMGEHTDETLQVMQNLENVGKLLGYPVTFVALPCGALRMQRLEVPHIAPPSPHTGLLFGDQKDLAVPWTEEKTPRVRKPRKKKETI